MIKREEALKFLEEQIENRNIINHMLATEAVMKALAQKLEPDRVKEYGLAGLLHDGDYNDQTPVKKQGIEVSNILKQKGYEISESVSQAMAAHNWDNNGVEPETKMDWALYCCDSLTGLIVATALVRPDKKLASVEVKSVLKKFKDKDFARGTRREEIELCEEKLGIPLPEFIDISLKAMQEIASKIGL
jgi:predicted hydrolase (HD superfamily)